MLKGLHCLCRVAARRSDTVWLRACEEAKHTESADPPYWQRRVRHTPATYSTQHACGYTSIPRYAVVV
jgi:hypothetical protein